MMKCRRINALTALVAIGLIGIATDAASAGSVTANLTSSATVNGTCTVGGSALVFGAYTGVLTTAATTMTVNCTSGLVPLISLNTTNAAGNRTLVNGTRTLLYTLYTDAAGTIPWGNTVTVAATADGTNHSYPVASAIAAGQTTFAGTYADTATITVNF